MRKWIKRIICKLNGWHHPKVIRNHWRVGMLLRCSSCDQWEKRRFAPTPKTKKGGGE